MMKKQIVAIFLFISTLLWAQPDTEVYTFTIKYGNGILKLTDPRNISNNPGYDNQPSFYDSNTVLFSSTREGQTDILKFNIQDGSTASWLTDTPTGSEYSPLRIPESNAFSAIRLDLDGLQRLYAYDPKNDVPKEIITGAKIGYHVWYTPDILIATVLKENRMDLVSYSIADGSLRTEKKNVGRSLQKIPETRSISYIDKENNDDFKLMSLDPVTGETNKIASIGKTEDVCWLPDGSILVGKEKTIYRFRPEAASKWSVVQQFTDKNINKITRIAVNGNGSRLAIVAETSPENIVQKKVENFNSRNLDQLTACFSENVLVGNFPADTLYMGDIRLAGNYQKLYAKAKKTRIEVLNRMSIGNTVIEEELVSIDNKTTRQVVIYRVKNGAITSMNIISENTLYGNDTENIVQERLNAYNKKDTEAFLNSYANNVEVYDYPNKIRYKGIKNMRQTYAGIFNDTTESHQKTKKSILIGNKVINEEYTMANGTDLSTIAIYEIKNGKIAKVTFIK